MPRESRFSSAAGSPGGRDAVARDLALLSDRIAADHPGLPLFLLGHSRGSHQAQDYARRWRGRYGISDLSEKYYEGARHDVFEETNKAEVKADRLAWMEARRGRDS